MSTKRMKVYICDYCEKIEAPKVVAYYGDVFTTKPDGWISKCRMDLCPTCGSNFRKVMEGKSDESVSE